MALTQVTGPYPIFTDLDGSPLDDGYLYIGAANQDPETNPIQVFWDSGLTLPATQPIRTNNGYAWRNGTPGLLYTAGEFSITIRNKRNEFVLYSPLGYGFDPKAVSASVVKNDFTGDGVETDFTLSASPSTKLATNVFINGVYQEKDSYSLNGNVITFSVAPPLGSSIEVMTNETGVINSGNATAISYTASFPGAVAQTVQTKLEQYVSVKDFGAVGDGVTDDRAACQSAIDAVRAAGGGVVYFPEGTYLLNGTASSDTTLNGLLVPYVSPNGTADRVILQGQGASTVLLAGSDNMYIIRYSDSHGGVRDMSLDANGKTGVIGLGCVPESTVQTTNLVFQLYNIFSGLYFISCDEGAVFKAGPDVGGSDSGCWYNSLENSQFIYCKRGIWMRSGPNASSSPANRNSFINVRIGQATNTGVQIDAADTCKFYAVSFEGINTGSSPNTTPTAIKIAASDVVSGLDNNSNVFMNCSFEANTRDLDNYNTRSQFFACNFTGTKINTSGGANVGFVCLGGDDASQAPQVALGSVYQTNNQLSAYNNGLTFPTLTGVARVSQDGPFVNTISFEETSGKSATIANGATFTVTVATQRRPQLLFVYSGANLNIPGVYLVSGDSVANITVSTIASSAGIAVAGTAPNQVTITNNFGLSTRIYYTLTPFGVAVPL